MKIDLYNYGSLNCDVPKYNLYAGDIVLVIDYLIGNEQTPAAYIVESFNALGDTLAVFSIPIEYVNPLYENAVFHIRSFEMNEYQKIA